MAGALTISTLNDSSGVLATQNGMTGIAKAWANWNGVSGVTIRASFNVSSITRSQLGLYTVNFTNAMPNVNYAVNATSSANSGGGLCVATLNRGSSLNTDVPPTTTAFNIGFVTTGQGYYDVQYANVAVYT